MEDEKKKKRQKKKKNKQAKTTDSIPADVGTQASENNNHVNSSEQLQPNQDSESADVQTEGLQKSDVDSDRQPIDGLENAMLERKIKELQEVLDGHMQKEVDLEKNILQLQDERNSWLHKELLFSSICYGQASFHAEACVVNIRLSLGQGLYV